MQVFLTLRGEIKISCEKVPLVLSSTASYKFGSKSVIGKPELFRHCKSQKRYPTISILFFNIKVRQVMFISQHNSGYLVISFRHTLSTSALILNRHSQNIYAMTF